MARPASRPGNLPAEATSFVGRRRERAEIKGRLAGSRVVSLVGPGGVGKSRLAIRVAADMVRRFRDGAWLVELAEIGDPHLVGHAVLSALDLRDQATGEPLALVLAHLRDKQALLVVDNCEHLLPAAARLATEVIRAAPGVRVIVTSREPLSIAGEHVVPVPPLDLTTAEPGAPLSQLRQNEAILLFAERAAAGSGRFELTAANRSAVVELCRRLDGLPLAIELAAVRTRVLTPHQILDRLTDRFALLTGGDGSGLPRHQTLRTTIDWSHDLLTAEEQTLLRRLCVFGGRFTIDGVEAVCESTLDQLSSLVDKSLVLKEDVGPVALYRLHETMREYANLKLLAAGETEDIESRCTEYYRARCRSSGQEVRFRIVEWLDWMDLEIDNIRSVLGRCVAQGDARRGLDLASSMGWYWVTRATSEGARWLDELLSLESSRPAPLALFIRGFLAVLQTDAKAADPVLERGIGAARDAGHAGLESMTLAMASIARHMSGDPASAHELLDAGAAISDRMDDYSVAIMVLQARSLIGLFERDAVLVRAAASEGVRLSRAVGDLYSLEMMLVNVGCAALVGDDPNEAEPLFLEALRIAAQIDDRVGQYCLLIGLAYHASRCGQAERAATLLAAAEAVQASVGASILPHLGELIHEATTTSRGALGDAAFHSAFRAGQCMSREAAIRLALGEDEPATAPESGHVVRLGKRQAQVARLVAEGLGNKQIAARLLISEYTVDSHIRGILDKLGFGSRAQIAAWVASQPPPA